MEWARCPWCCEEVPVIERGVPCFNMHGEPNDQWSICDGSERAIHESERVIRDPQTGTWVTPAASGTGRS